jgi:Ca-activated chloride channel family protein
MLNSKHYENSRPDGISALEIVRPSERESLFVPLKRTELSGEVAGPLAALRLTQTYGYTREQCDQTLEAVYRFPLPGDAAVTGVRITFGEVEILAELKERGQAETEYKTAKREGRQAALATRESPDVFTLQVAGLQPDQDVKVETSYVQLARAEGRGWSLRIPLTTAPRYVRGDEVNTRHAHAQPLALLRDPGHRFALDLHISGTAKIESQTHALITIEESGGLRARLQDGEVIPDRDCVLVWQPMQVQAPALQAFVHEDKDDAQLYFLAMIAPPASGSEERRIPREAILLVDHSGSMEGPKWAAADWAVKSFLYGLSERDDFALGLFHNTTRWFKKQLCRADGKAVEEAIQFLERYRDSGGTELGVALEQAIGLERSRDERARHVLIITDAEVSDAGRILRLADDESQQPNARRISVLCIDAAPNSHLAMELAERGGGIARFLTSDPAEEDISTALDEVLTDWAEPTLVGLRLEVNRQVAQSAGRSVRTGSESGWSAIDLGDLPAGRTIYLAGRVPRGGINDLNFRVIAGGDSRVADCRVDPSQVGNHPAIKALFGARRVLGLEYLIHSRYENEELLEQLVRLGFDPGELRVADTKRKVYAENTYEDANAALRALLVREALSSGLASSETAYVATRKEAGKLIDATVAVANALPSGWSDSFGGMILGSARMMKGTLLMAADPTLPLAASPPPVAPGSPERQSWLSSIFNRASSDSADDQVMFDTVATPAETAVPPVSENSQVVFSGSPALTDSNAILFDSVRDQSRSALPDRATIRLVRLRFPGGAPNANEIDAGLSLLIFVDDLSTPRAKVRLIDILRQRGERPLNLLVLPGQSLRIVLSDTTGVWKGGAPQIEVALEWDRG